LVSNRFTVGLLGSVGRLEFCRGYVAEVAVEALGVVPVHPGEGGEFDVADAAPGAPGGAADQFGHHTSGRSSSAAKKAEADFKIAFARRSSRFSCSSSLIL